MATILTPASALLGARASRWRRRGFYIALPIAMLVAVFVGFAPTYYLKGIFGTPGLSSLYHVHGLLFTAWLLLLIAQTTLIAMGRTSLHRELGAAGGVLAGLMTIAAILVTVDLGRRGVAPPGVSPLAFLIVPFTTIIVFPALIGAALVWRKKAGRHKRLMLIGTLELLPAGFGRWPLIASLGPLAYFGLTDLFLVAMLMNDRATRGHFHPATVWGGSFLVASQIGRLALGGTTVWQSFARWLIG